MLLLILSSYEATGMLCDVTHCLFLIPVLLWNSSRFPQRRWEWPGKWDHLLPRPDGGSLLLDMSAPGELHNWESRKTCSPRLCDLHIPTTYCEKVHTMCVCVQKHAFLCSVFFFFALCWFHDMESFHKTLLSFWIIYTRFLRRLWVIQSNPERWTWKGMCPCWRQRRQQLWVFPVSPEKTQLGKWKACVCVGAGVWEGLRAL